MPVPAHRQPTLNPRQVRPITSRLALSLMENTVNDTRYRTRVVEVQAIRWLGEENCGEVFAFLGLEHYDDEDDHTAIHGIGDNETAYPGDWIVRTGPDLDDCTVYPDGQFHAVYEAAGDA